MRGGEGEGKRVHTCTCILYMKRRTDRQTDRQRQKQIQTKDAGKQVDRQADRQTNKQADRHTAGHSKKKSSAGEDRRPELPTQRERIRNLNTSISPW